jgi:amino acid permease
VADTHLPWHSYYESLQFSAWNVFLESNWSTSIFLANYVPIILFPILYVAAKLIMGMHIVKADEMDFVTYVAEFDVMMCILVSCRECHVRARH